MSVDCVCFSPPCPLFAKLGNNDAVCGLCGAGACHRGRFFAVWVTAIWHVGYMSGVRVTHIGDIRKQLVPAGLQNRRCFGKSALRC